MTLSRSVALSVSLTLKASLLQGFYMEFLNKIRDDQLRFNENHGNDTGAVADVVPFDGIGGNPGCPICKNSDAFLIRRAVRLANPRASPFQGRLSTSYWRATAGSTTDLGSSRA